ncbi:uncharacterized protein LOC129585877 isoform X2 [Paramacrobiotus metropolitanus]|uniref:uncharacterized protein LOC129585877 isoform X2 n=1 Tax=Paramacrobiotus metropolitanus TaxID=2943436 RepID=UPI0024457B01|nr:uncharacterized protein LOC129585877 isoform X2 [Paramacrobiotus metropolitanus]
MLNLKRASSNLVRVVALELAFLGACYGVHRNLNHNQDFRYWMSRKAPMILDLFYKVGEKTIEGYGAREVDLIEFKRRDESSKLALESNERRALPNLNVN